MQLIFLALARDELAEAKRFFLIGSNKGNLYIVREERIVVIAVAHQHLQPDYWVDRTNP